MQFETMGSHRSVIRSFGGLAVFRGVSAYSLFSVRLYSPRSLSVHHCRPFVTNPRQSLWRVIAYHSAYSAHSSSYIHMSALRGCGSMAGRLARDVSVKSRLLALIAAVRPSQEVQGKLGGNFPFKLFKLFKIDCFTCRNFELV